MVPPLYMLSSGPAPVYSGDGPLQPAEGQRVAAVSSHAVASVAVGALVVGARSEQPSVYVLVCIGDVFSDSVSCRAGCDCSRCS